MLCRTESGFQAPSCCVSIEQALLHNPVVVAVEENILVADLSISRAFAVQFFRPRTTDRGHGYVVVALAHPEESDGLSTASVQIMCSLLNPQCANAGRVLAAVDPLFGRDICMMDVAEFQYRLLQQL